MITSSFLQGRVACPIKECSDCLQVCLLRSVDAPEIQQAIHPQPVYGVGVDAKDGTSLLCTEKLDRCSVHGDSFRYAQLPAMTYITPMSG